MAVSVDLVDTPRDITSGLDAGRYTAQVRADLSDPNRVLVLYATGEMAPADEGSYFQAGAGDTFGFRKGSGVAPTWARRAVGVTHTVSLAIALATGAVPSDAQPFPPSAADITAAMVAAELDIDETRAGRILEAALAMVGRYASAAPAEIANEAVLRFCGYLEEANYGALRSETTGDLESAHQNHAAMFRNCGAAALLSRWRVRRAGAIG